MKLSYYTLFLKTIVKINNWGNFFEKNKQWLNNFWKRFDIKQLLKQILGKLHKLCSNNVPWALVYSCAAPFVGQLLS